MLTAALSAAAGFLNTADMGSYREAGAASVNQQIVNRDRGPVHVFTGRAHVAF